MESFLERQYHLKQNPFSSRVDPRPPMAGRMDEKKRWTDVINQYKGKTGNSLNFIVGDYGLGKTFTLYKIIEQYTNVSDVLPVYLKLMREDKVQKFGLDFVQRVFKAVGVNRLRELFSKVDVSAIQSEFPDPSKIFQIILTSKNDDDNEELGLLAETFLYGDRNLTKSEIAKLGVRRSINSTEVAKEYFCSFLILLRTAKKSSVILAVDEVEYLFSQMRGAGLASVFNTLRDLYDLPDPSFLERFNLLNQRLANIIFFFGISQSGWSSITDLQRKERSTPGPVQPLLSRAHEVIELPPLDQKETKELIEKRLRLNRVTGKPESEPLIPYNEDFVIYIYALTLGNPRDIVIRCDYVLQDGLRDEVPLLTKEYAFKVFEAHRLSTEIPK